MATTNGSFGQQDQYKGATEQYTATASAESTNGNANGSPDLSKDEIGWYFVEQYYTTLSRSPEKLHLFYGKKSQFVSGLEAEVCNIAIGRPEIQERIKALDFSDCKVRVSNVDSQASSDNIVIQVIGETSNKGGEPKKFVQTFVLARQTSGYFVLNDIFRYIKEEVEEEIETAAGQEESSAVQEQVEDVEMPKAQEEPAPTGIDADIVDQKLEEEIAAESIPQAAKTNGDAAVATEADEAEETPAVIKPEEEVTPEVAEKEVDEEIEKAAETPKDPVPSPAVTRLPSTAKVAPVPALPAKPMSWANRAAAAAAASAPKPVIPQQPKSVPSTAPVTTRAPTAIAAPTPAPVKKENQAPQAQGSEWITAGSDNKTRQARPQSVSGPQEKEGTMGYVRNVTEDVQTEELRSALSNYGELVYFDVNRQKNCAFVEFATTAGYQAAFAANPHTLSGQDILVEPRRPKSSAYGGTGYNGNRGGLNTRGRGSFDARGGGQQRGRADFNNRGRGAPRGRGGNPAPTAA